ncbi:MAG: hypothetical protein Q9214_006037, partial [Letrouitia sp. 1 TL-2023]
SSLAQLDPPPLCLTAYKNPISHPTKQPYQSHHKYLIEDQLLTPKTLSYIKSLYAMSGLLAKEQPWGYSTIAAQRLTEDIVNSYLTKTMGRYQFYVQ